MALLAPLYIGTHRTMYVQEKADTNLTASHQVIVQRRKIENTL
jgi:hypothetical protein